ncbi:MAG: hypothetical protein R2798_13805 [Chitinophagales bacterium]|nr:hypothetical protein [Bacteroidota bacterium]
MKKTKFYFLALMVIIMSSNVFAQKSKKTKTITKDLVSFNEGAAKTRIIDFVKNAGDCKI